MSNWYVSPPSSLQVVRADGAHVLDAHIQRDRVIGSRTRSATPVGTVFDFTRVSSGGVPWAQFDDATWQAINGASLFSDCTVTQAGSYNPDTSAVALQNWGTHPQLCLMIGDSLMDSSVGASPSNGLSLPQNWCWTQPVVSKGLPYTVGGEPYAFWNRAASMNDPAAALSRICWKFAWGGWRLATLPGITYPGTTGAHADQTADYTTIPIASGQKLDVVIQAGTNDEHSAGTLTLYGSPDQGSPNLVSDCLVPLVTLLRAQLPIHKIGVMTPIARGSDGQAAPRRNQAAADYAAWLVAGSNAASIGVDAVWDARSDPALDPNAWATNTLDPTIYQADHTHLTANGYVAHLGPGATGLLDQFWNTP